jgi:hypothetical protein
MFNHGEYVWLDRADGPEMVMIEETLGRGRVAVRFINSETMIVVNETALDREHPKARAATMIRQAAGR